MKLLFSRDDNNKNVVVTTCCWRTQRTIERHVRFRFIANDILYKYFINNFYCALGTWDYIERRPAGAAFTAADFVDALAGKTNESYYVSYTYIMCTNGVRFHANIYMILWNFRVYNTQLYSCTRFAHIHILPETTNSCFLFWLLAVG